MKRTEIGLIAGILAGLAAIALVLTYEPPKDTFQGAEGERESTSADAS